MALSSRRSSVSRRRELVTLPVHGDDERGPIGIGLELPSEPQDVRVHRSRGGELFVPPDLVEQAVARDGLTPVLQEVREQVEFLAGEGELTAGLEDLAAATVHAHVAKGQLVRLLAWTRPPQHRAYAGQQLTQRERLGQVIVGAQLQPAHTIDFLPARREHDDGHVDRPSPELPTHVPAAQLGHHDVEDDQIRRRLHDLLQRLLAVEGAGRLVALVAKVVLEPTHDLGLVVDDQDARDGRSPFGATGSQIVKRLPSPTRLSTVTRPPWASATWRTRASPTPLPRRPCVSLRPTR